MYLILSDGGDREGTYGSFKILDNTGEAIAFRTYYWGIGDHNQAEYWALLYAVNKAIDLRLKEITIFTDSETVAEQVTFERPLHKKRLKRIRNQIVKKLEEFDTWEIQKVDRSTVEGVLGH